MEKKIIIFGIIMVVALGVIGYTGFYVASLPSDEILMPMYDNIYAIQAGGGAPKYLKVNAGNNDVIYCPPYNIYNAEGDTEMNEARSVDSCEVSVYIPTPPAPTGFYELEIEKCDKNSCETILHKYYLFESMLYSDSSVVGSHTSRYISLDEIEGNLMNIIDIKSMEWLKIKKSWKCNIRTPFTSSCAVGASEAELTYKLSNVHAYILMLESANGEKTEFYKGEDILEKGIIITSSQKEKIPKEDWDSAVSSGLIEETPEKAIIMAGEEHSINYFSAFVPFTYATKFNYMNTIPIVCSGSYVYPIKEEKMADGTVKKFADLSGKTYVKCCPSTDNPYCELGSDGIPYIVTPETATVRNCPEYLEGAYRAGGEFISVGDKMIRQKCVSGEWVTVEEIENGCLDGCGVNEYCDPDTYQCVSIGDYFSLAKNKGETVKESENIDLGNLTNWLLLLGGGIFLIIVLVLGLIVFILIMWLLYKLITR